MTQHFFCTFSGCLRWIVVAKWLRCSLLWQKPLWSNCLVNSPLVQQTKKARERERERDRGCAWMRQPSSESFCSSFHQVNYFSTPGSVPVRSWKPGPWMGQLACMHHQRPSTRSRTRKKVSLISSLACGVMKTSLIKTLPLTELHTFSLPTVSFWAR